jgi:hypothetical protein
LPAREVAGQWNAGWPKDEDEGEDEEDEDDENQENDENEDNEENEEDLGMNEG